MLTKLQAVSLSPIRACDRNAGVAQLVERQLPKLNVDGSSPFTRFEKICRRWPVGSAAVFFVVAEGGDWRDSESGMNIGLARSIALCICMWRIMRACDRLG